MAFAKGIALNMSPPSKPETTQGKSSTMHFMCGKVSAMVLAIVLLLPPTSTNSSTL